MLPFQIVFLFFFGCFFTGLMPSTDIQQALAEMFSEAVNDLENEIIRAVVCTNAEEQVV